MGEAEGKTTGIIHQGSIKVLQDGLGDTAVVVGVCDGEWGRCGSEELFWHMLILEVHDQAGPSTTTGQTVHWKTPPG